MATYTRAYGPGNDYIAPSDGYSLYVIDGGAGTDTVFADARSGGFTISPVDASGVTTVSGASGTTLKLTNVEKIAFKDGRTFTLDTATTGPGPAQGTAGNDVFHTSAGNETFDGAGGIDTLQVGLARANTTLTKTAAGWALSGPGIGSDTLQNVERLQFSDSKWALDVAPSGNAGKAVQCLGAVAAVMKMDPGLIGAVLGLVDNVGVQGMFQWALNNGAIQQLAGGGSNVQIAALAYHNVTGQPADAGTAAMLASNMDNGMGQAEFLSWASTFVDLTGVQNTGVAYL